MEASARNSQVHFSQEATRRLLRDWKEVQKEPIDTVVAKPLENDLSEWHCNLIPDEGPYQGTAFHLILKFPVDYPNTPPNVRPCTFLSHPNVFGDWICLDMIKEPEYCSRPYQGWSTAYSVQSVLLQLQSFLFAENVPQDWGGNSVNRAAGSEIARAKREAAAFHCAECGFRGFSNAAATAPNLPRDGNTVVLNGRLARWANNLDDTVEERFTVRTRGEVRTPRTPDHRGRAPRARPVPNTVNELIARALDRSARAASPSASEASSEGGRVAPTEALQSPPRVPTSPPTQSPQTSAKSSNTPAKVVVVPAPRGPPTLPNPGPAAAPQTVADPEPAAAQNPETPADRLSELSTDVLVQILDRLDAPSLSALVRASRHYARAATERGAWVRRELQCFHTKRSFGEEVLGFGVATKGEEVENDGDYGCPCPMCRPDRRAERKPKVRGRWEPVLSMDYLSAGAFFEGGVRRGVWNERLEWWLPLILDDQHCARALPLLKGTIAALAANPRRPSLPRADILRHSFSSLDTLKVLPRLMNGMVVSFMKQGSAGNKADLHASEKALLGYCQLHHMLLRLAQDYPALQTAIDRALSRFQSTPTARHKNETPDLGELLVLLSVAKTGGVTWDSLAPAFVAETFDRNVLWLLREHPELAVLEAADCVSEHRLATTFNATATSRRLIMFQVAFLLLVRPSGSSVRDILAEYGQRYGYPRPGLTRKLQETWYRVRKVATWPAYFAELGLPCPSNPALSSMLRQAVVSSSRKGYHSVERLRSGLNLRGLVSLRQQKERARGVSPSVTGRRETGPWRREGRDNAEGNGPVSSASSGQPQPSSWWDRPNRASSTARDQRAAPRQPSQPTVVSLNPFAVLEIDSE
ncbi:protein with Ubiquitin-conjugating enzyme domain [Klebsormidium nitens]|uniref:Protein with Ubiquitin-conjugating enzyme domain n=1 Tax=Klebsormidium nitens TaxID=105231 RepID=A0A1Y1I5F4_KLENI|nr:protein with Ubiquitin-conjugating enzyme domain [Klebsormidium nitens]|eukprot:GAQ84649.1 protein with Ubiquitin-conjugating enzyme domain [Klebsormidium nitens]